MDNKDIYGDGFKVKLTLIHFALVYINGLSNVVTIKPIAIYSTMIIGGYPTL